MPALSEVLSRRGLLAATGATLLSSCGSGSQETPKPITAPRPGETAGTKPAVSPVATIKATEVLPTPEPKGSLWTKQIKRETLTDRGMFPRQGSNPDEWLENPSFLADGSRLHIRLGDGTIAELDPKSSAQISTTGEQGALVGSNQDSVFFLRHDLRLYRFDKTSRRSTLIVDTPEAAFQGGRAAENHYSYPARFGDGFFALPAAPTRTYIYSFDGSYKERLDGELLVGVSGSHILTYSPQSSISLISSSIRIRKPGSGGALMADTVHSRPLLSPNGLFAGAARFGQDRRGIRPFVYSLTENKEIYNAKGPIANLDYGSEIVPTFVSGKHAVFEVRSDNSPSVFYYLINLGSGQITTILPQPYGSEFFGDESSLYWSTPARSTLRAFDAVTGKEKWDKPNNDIKAAELVGKAIINDKQILLIRNWNQDSTRLRTSTLSPNEKCRITALDDATGEKLWTVDAPDKLEDSRNGLPYYPPQTLLVGERLFFIGNTAYEVNLTSGITSPIQSYKADSSARVVKFDNGLLFVQTMSNLQAIRL